MEKTSTHSSNTLTDQALDNLTRRIVRRRGQCERCGTYENLTVAHIVRRGYHWTRWFPQNCLLLCWYKCHFYFTNNPILWENYCRYKIGDKMYEYLKQLSLRTDDIPREEMHTYLQSLL